MCYSETPLLIDIGRMISSNCSNFLLILYFTNALKYFFLLQATDYQRVLFTNYQMSEENKNENFILIFWFYIFPKDVTFLTVTHLNALIQWLGVYSSTDIFLMWFLTLISNINVTGIRDDTTFDIIEGFFIKNYVPWYNYRK